MGFDRETLDFLDVNEAAVRQYGFSRREFLTMKITQIRPPEEVAAVLERIEHPRGPTTGDHWRHRHKNGAIFTVSITSWDLIFRGRPAELVLARREEMLR